MFFLSDFAEFNRKINIKAYTKIIKGKVVPVSRSQRTLLRLKDALTDLRRRGGKTHEGAYLLNPKNSKVGEYIPGEKDRVFMNKPYKIDRHKLHNHPSDTGFSIQDLVSAQVTNSNMTHVITPNGSWYRASNINIGNDDIETLESLEEDLPFIFQMEKSIENKGDLKLNTKQVNNSWFAAKYAILKDLHNNGLITFRAKLQSKDKQIIKYYEPQIDKFLKQDKSYTIKQNNLDDDWDDWDDED